jgi:hypothetical protein
MLAVVTAWLSLRALVGMRDWHASMRMAVGWVLGIGLSAPAWLSLIEISRGSRRAGETFPARQWMVPLDGLPGFILPAWTVDWVRFEAEINAHPALELACGFAPAIVLLVAAVSLAAGSLVRIGGYSGCSVSRFWSACCRARGFFASASVGCRLFTSRSRYSRAPLSSSG